jgi:hypothetical protein
MRFIGALDLGQVNDPSAFVLAETSTAPDPDPDRAGYRINLYDVRAIHRWELGTKYTHIVQDLRGWFSQSVEIHNMPLVIDGTGVGRPVVDMIEDCHFPAYIRPYTITAGFRETEGDGKIMTVPKIDLVRAAQAAVDQRRVRYADGLEHGPTLEKEMRTFRTKVTPDRNETFASWREKDNDDIVLALALLIWYGEKNGCGPPVPYPIPNTTIDEQIEAAYPSYLRGRPTFRG